MKLPKLAHTIVAALVIGGVFVAIGATGRWDELVTQPVTRVHDSFDADAQRRHAAETETARPSTRPSTDAATRTAAADALTALNDVDVAHTRRTPPYVRRDFGSAWTDVDNNGCDTRNDILRRDLTDIVSAPNGCIILRGHLHDPYTGREIPFTRGPDTSAQVQIDHVVPLSYAWKNGAWAWDDATRRRFANDPINLVAAAEAPNREKSDSGPGEWMPADTAYRCEYSVRFVNVLRSYDLPATDHDVAELRRTLEGCS